MGYRRLAAFISRYPRFIILCWVFIIGMSAVWAWKLPDICSGSRIKTVTGMRKRLNLFWRTNSDLLLIRLFWFLRKRKIPRRYSSGSGSRIV